MTVGDKELPQAVIERSVISRPEDVQAGSLDTSLLWFVANAADEMTAWGVNPKRRDRELRDFVPTENYFASALGIVCARNMAFSWTVEGPPRVSARFQEVLDNANLGEGWQDFIAKFSYDLYCLAGTSKVALGGERLGQKKTILQIVRDRDPGPVLTVGSDGHLTDRKVIQGKKTPLGGRKGFWISLKESSGHSRKQRGGLFLTDDHPVLTIDGWLAAGHVRCGMRVVTGDPAPSEEQMELLVGTLLGDGALQGMRKTFVKLCHSVKQREWLELKQRALSGFLWQESGVFGENSFVVQHSRSTAGLNELRGRWYSPKKRLDREGVRRYWGPRLLATWYADDGSTSKVPEGKEDVWRQSIVLSSESFSQEDNEWLSNFLTSKGLPNAVQEVSPYWRLSFGVDASEKIFEAVAPYLPSCLRYKLPKSVEKRLPFQEDLWELEPARPFVDECVVAEPRPYY